MRRLGIWTDERGQQFDEDYFAYPFVPNPTSPTSGLSGTLAPGAAAICNVSIEQDSAFEWVMSTCSASVNGGDTVAGNAANIAIQISDSGSGRNLFNEPLPMGLVAGDGRFAYLLPFPRRFLARSSITISMVNYDTATTYKDIAFNMIGRKIYVPPGRHISRFKSWRDPQTGRIMAEDFFAYHFQFGSVAPAANLQVQQLIENDSDFECRTMSGCNNTTLATGTNADMSGLNYLQLLDGGSQRYLSNAPVIAPYYVGNHGLPLILPTPRIFLARTSVIWSLTNNSAGVTNTRSDIVMAGRKIFEVNE